MPGPFRFLMLVPMVRAKNTPVISPLSSRHDPRHSDCRIVALDFETADGGRDSACALAMVKMVGGSVVDKLSMLIRPPRRTFLFTYIHGITWNDVAGQPTFAEQWSSISRFLSDATLLTAHNAPFDRGVLNACCVAAGVEPPPLPFFCTVQLSRKTWDLASHSLPIVCNHLRLTLDHHKAESDALACACIVQEAVRRHGEAPLPWKPLR